MNNDEPRRLPAGRGFTLSYQRKLLLSRVDPIGRAEKLVYSLSARPSTLYFCPSPLYGYGLDVLLDRIDVDSAVIAVEADQRLFDFTVVELTKRLGNRPCFGYLNCSSAEELSFFVRRLFGTRRFRRVIELRLNSGWLIAENNYQTMLRSLEDEIALDWSNALTLTKLGRRYALNSIRNLAALAEATTIEAGFFGNSPLIALGAGPSLDTWAKTLAAAPEVRKRYRLLCVDTALKALLDRGLTPDLTVVLEAQFWNLRDFIGLDQVLNFACDLSAYPASVRAGGGHPVFFHIRWTGLRFLDRLCQAGLAPPERPALGSVGLSLVDLALQLTSGPIGLAGLDFSFSLDGYHAKGTPSQLERLNHCNRFNSLINPQLVFRPGTRQAVKADGHSYWTDPALRRYHGLFLREFSGHSRLFNLSAAGPDLGVKQASLDDLLQAAKTITVLRPASAKQSAERQQRLIVFIEREIDWLLELRAALSGQTAGLDEIPGRASSPKPAKGLELERLTDELDYLWAHFPECAGTTTQPRRPTLTDQSFAKRLRAEIDPFIKAFKLARSELIPRCF